MGIILLLIAGVSFIVNIQNRFLGQIIPKSPVVPSIAPSPIEQSPTFSPPTITPQQNTLQYTDATYNFSMTMPKSWEGYQVSHHDYEDYSDIAFYFPPPHEPFTILQITVRTPAQWSKTNDTINKLKTMEQNNLHFTFDYDQEFQCVQLDEFQCARSKEILGIVDTVIFNDQL